jgi:hypothetical protein
MLKDPGTDGTSLVVQSRNGRKPCSLKDPKVKLAQPGALIDCGLTSFAQAPPVHGDALAHVAPIRTGASTIYSHAGASSTIHSLLAAFEASIHTISLEDKCNTHFLQE